MAVAKAKIEAAFRAAELAKAAGMPRAQLENFWRAGHVPLPRQMEFHAACRLADSSDGPTDIAFGGARGGGKSRAIFSQLSLDDCQRQPGLKCLFLRKVGKAARESFEDLRRQTIMGIRHNYRAHLGQLDFPNDSRVVLGHFKTEGDIDQYLGIEYDVIAIEEDTQLSAAKKRDIKTCLRTSKPSWRPRTYRSTNPGGIDHEGFKKTFIVPWREKRETTTRFIPATVKDNPFVNKEYKATLENLVGWKRAAWLDGEWDIAAGQYFSNWRHDAVVFDAESFRLPSSWVTWAGFDYGFTHPTVFLLLAEHDGEIWVFDEHVKPKTLVEHHAEAIKEMAGRHGRELRELWKIAAGGDCFQQKGDRDAKTIAEQYKAHGVILEPAPMDRVSGWSELIKLLGDPDNGISPRIHISSKCTRLIETIPMLQHDPDRPEDVDKTDVDEGGAGGDDTADALRYGIMARIRRKAAPITSRSSSFFSGR